MEEPPKSSDALVQPLMTSEMKDDADNNGGERLYYIYVY